MQIEETKDHLITKTLSYDDILLLPSYSEVLPGDVSTRTLLAGEIYLNVPILSAAMDTVTEEAMAIAIALEGGAGVIHRNLAPEEQARQAGRVKRFLNWIIEEPLTVHQDMTLNEVRRINKEHAISGLPVVDEDNKLVGIITKRDMRFCEDFSQEVRDVMTANPVTAPGNIQLSDAEALFDKHRIEKIPLVDTEGRITGLITVKDMEKQEAFPHAALDRNGRLIVGAALSPQDFEVRIPLLVENKVDFVVLDTAHGDSLSVINAVREIKKRWNIVVIGGNVATAEGTRRLIDAGADAVKVGVGPGSICTTRIIAGIGVPQFSAVLWCAQEAEKDNIPVIADGGIKFSGDITKAICAGASSVMLGNLLAGLKEAPGREIIYDGRMFKQYRGMGSLGAIKEGSGDRYQVKGKEAPVPEGIEGRVPYKGELQPFLHQLATGLRKGLFYCGCKNLAELREYKKYVKISPAGLEESHAHDIMVTHEAPNYSH